MLAQAGQLYHSRNLLWAWTGRNIRARYQQSVLGWFWALFQPAAQVIIFTIVFTQFIPIDTGEIPYPVFSYIAVAPWAFLAASLQDMTDSLVANMGLVTKVYFPREVLPLAAMLARLLDFGVAAGLLVILVIVFGGTTFTSAWSLLPLVFAIQWTLILGLGLACAALNVFFRDVRSLLVLGLQLWFYATPIIYPVTMVPEHIQPLYFLNPMAGVIQAYRDILLSGHAPGFYLIPAALAAIAIFVMGYSFFKQVEFQFADIV